MAAIIGGQYFAGMSVRPSYAGRVYKTNIRIGAYRTGPFQMM
jgi:hypothetical protein